MKKALLRLFSCIAPLLVTATAFAEEAAAGGYSGNITTAAAYFAAGIGIGIAAFGGALGQGRAAAMALEGIARNPSASDKLFVPMILGLALIESLVIYALVIAIMLVGK
jgi:F-type H+-transporting ATPase subunit c